MPPRAGPITGSSALTSTARMSTYVNICPELVKVTPFKETSIDTGTSSSLSASSQEGGVHAGVVHSIKVLLTHTAATSVPPKRHLQSPMSSKFVPLMSTFVLPVKGPPRGKTS